MPPESAARRDELQVQVQYRLVEALQEREHQLAEAQRLAHLGSWTWEFATDTVSWTDELYRIFGVSPSGFTPTYDGFLDLVHRNHRSRVEELVQRSLENGTTVDLECPIVRPNGEKRWIHVLGTLVHHPDGAAVRMHGTVHDVTRTRARLTGPQALLKDPLTGLATRTLVEDRATRALARARRAGTRTALLVLDINNFHEVNDDFGIAVGDQVLAEVGRRLDTAFRLHDTVGVLEDTVGRLGGDEFIVVCEQLDVGVPPSALGERVLAALEHPLEVDDQSINVTASCGIAVAAPGAVRLEELYLRADGARRAAKRDGRGRYEVFSDQERAPSARADEEALRGALERGEFRLAYQPKINLATDRIGGTEALLRWDHPDRGPVPPLDFIPLAEETGLIVPIGAWVISEACRQIASWEDRFPAGSAVMTAVNVSGKQFTADLVGVVADALSATGVRPESLCLEVTESMLMTDVEGAVRTLRALADLGVGLSIDDFGTGYSSLAYLKRFPIDELKIDKSFVDGLGQDPDDTAIVAAVMGMAHALNLAVVAEGVESAEQLAQLRTLGCEYAQGYYFSRPVGPDDVDQFHRVELSAGGEAMALVGGSAQPAARPARVLVIDDAPDVRMLARMSLAAAGFEVHEGDGGSHGLALARNVPPDCILVDLVMPDISGLDVCRALRADAATASCTILMLSGNDDPADKAEAFACGIDDYIVKPFSPRDLTSRVHAAMRRRRQAAATGATP